MIGLRILVGNEPRSYREAISGAIECMRPDAEVLTVEPEELDLEVPAVAASARQRNEWGSRCARDSRQPCWSCSF